MGDGTQPRRGGTPDHPQVDGLGRLWLWSFALVMLLTSTERLPRGPEATERARPVRIGALTDSWGSTPHMAGLTNLTLELGSKRLELFRELVPGLHRVLYPYDATHAPSVALAHVYRDAARHLGIDLVEKPVRTEAEVQEMLAQVRERKIDGIVQPSSVSLNIPGFLVEATAQWAIPTMFESMFFVERGGLASYGPDDYASGWQAARLVDKILKGTDPREIPVEVSTK